MGFEIWKNIDENKKNLYNIIGTHYGLFHNDEVVACAILIKILQYLGKNNIAILRSRNNNKLCECDICVDIGKSIGKEKFDHHYKGYNEKRDYGENNKFASAGLVFRCFGKYLIRLINPKLTEDDIKRLYNEIDRDIIQPIDMDDNGIPVDSFEFDFIKLFNPSWYEKTPDFNGCFERALELTIKTLDNVLDKKVFGKKIEKDDKVPKLNINDIIKKYRIRFKNSIPNVIEMINATDDEAIQQKISTLAGEEITPDLIDTVNKKLQLFFDKHKFEFSSEAQRNEIIEEKIRQLVDEFFATKTIEILTNKPRKLPHTCLQIPAQTMPWEEGICNYNDRFPDAPINFVMFPYPNEDGEEMWALQCVPPSLDKKMENRISLPKDDKEREGISFIHPNHFFARGTKKALLKLCQEAIDLHKKNDNKVDPRLD